MVPVVQYANVLSQFFNGIHFLIPMSTWSEESEAVWNFLDDCFSNTVVAPFNYGGADTNFSMKMFISIDGFPSAV